MSNSLTATDLKKLVPTDQSPNVYIKLVKEQLVGSKLTTNDMLLFLYAAKRAGLDPLLGQIHAVPRWDSRASKNKMSIQTGIDGFRLIAQRSGQYAGQDDVIFEGKEGTPAKASVTVYKKLGDEKVAFTASARWSEYVQTKKDGKPMHMWAKMPYTMLGKCAESLALRKAFPNELSGIYTSEEMGYTAPTQDLPTPERFNKKSQEAAGSNLNPEKTEEITLPQTGGKDSTARRTEAPEGKSEAVSNPTNESPSEKRKKLLEKNNADKS